MNRGKILLGLALAALPATSFAQTVGNGFTADGYMALAYLDFPESSGEFAILGDVDASLSFGAFGIDLSVVTFETDGYGNTEFFGGLSYMFGNQGKIVVGMPRSAYDRYGKFNIGDTSRYAGTVMPFTDKSIHTPVSSILAINKSVGVRYDSRTDDSLKYSVSYLHERDLGLNSLGGSVSFTNGPTTYAGGLEYTTDGSVDLTQAKVMIEQEFNVFTFGGAASLTDLNGTQLNYIEGSVVWEPVDVVDITGFIARSDVFGTSQNYYGFGGKYSFEQGPNVGASAVRVDSETLYEFSVGLDF